MSENHAPRTIEELLEHQRSWAKSNGLTLDPTERSFADRASALFVQELSQPTLEDLAQGAGSELNRIQSLRSSSCLALNTFEPWRFGPGALSEIFGVTPTHLQFEQKQPTGLKGVAPHLDVFLGGAGYAVGIESKFLEMYSPAQNQFSDSYFMADGLWEGLGNSRDLAERIASGDVQFRWLHAAQLLKHALGLRRNQPADYRLVLLWYRLDAPIVEETEKEIGRFTERISDDFDFTSMTYQELANRLHALEEPTPGYLSYLRDRYCLDGQWQRSLPLLDNASQPEFNHRTSLATTIENVDIEELSDSYYRSLAAAPQRPLKRKQFLVGHDGTGDASSSHSEKVVAKALFNSRTPLQIQGHSVTLVDYEVPLRAERADGGIGEIDLLGLDETNRPWIIELKVSPNTETPLKALMQALRYSAILDANRHAVAHELHSLTGGNTAWPAVLAVAADRSYWHRLLTTTKAGNWLDAIRLLGDRIESRLGNTVMFLDLGDLDVHVEDGRANLVSEPMLGIVSRPGPNRTGSEC